MPVIDPSRRADARGDDAVPSLAIPVAAGLILGAVFLVAMRTLPAAHVLPVVCLVSLALAAAASVVALKYRTQNAARPTYWDLAGALTFIGMGAAILSEPDQFVSLLNAGREGD